MTQFMEKDNAPKIMINAKSVSTVCIANHPFFKNDSIHCRVVPINFSNRRLNPDSLTLDDDSVPLQLTSQSLKTKYDLVKSNPTAASFAAFKTVGIVPPILPAS